MRTRFWLVVALVALVGCGGRGGDLTTGDSIGTDSVVPDGMGPWDADVEPPAGLSLRVDREPVALVLVSRDGSGHEVDVASFPTLSFGTVSSYNEEINYEPYWFYRGLDGKPAEKLPAGFARTTVTGVSGEVVATVGGGLQATLVTDAGHLLALTAAPEGDRGVVLTVSPATDSPAGLPTIVTSAWHWPMAEGENFYGTGERFDAVALRGTFVGFQFEALASESGYNEAHVPVPLVIGATYGVYVEETRPGVADFGTIVADEARLEFMHDTLRVHLFAGAPLEVVSAYTAVAGRPNIPAWWAFAPQQWRNEVHGVDEVLDDAARARETGVPVGVMWIDRPWEKSYHDFTFNPNQFPEPQAMLDELRQKGFRVVTWTAPYQTPDSDVYAQFESEGLFVNRPVGWPTASYSDTVELVDFTNPRAVELWTDLVHRVTDMGVEGFKFDYGEDVQVGIMGKRVHFSFFNGEDERTMHHLYCKLWHQVAHDLLGPGNGFLMARSGMPGGQSVVNSIWPGDLDNDFSYRLEVVDGRPATGGLPAAIRASLSLSASGYPIFSSDTGGFRNGRPTKEVLLRWVQHTALTPILQFGGGGNTHNPWDFEGKGDEPKYDQETLDIFKKYAALHIELFPYLFTYAVQARDTGVPIQRPFGMQEPADGRHPDDQYFFGEHLFVAPVERAETIKVVELPPGTWLDWWTDESVEGPATFERPAPLDTLPLYVRAGAVIPMLEPGVQTLSNNPELDPGALASTELRLRARVVPGAAAEFALYDGSSFVLSADAAPSIAFTPGSAFRLADLEIVVAAAPSAVTMTVDGADASLAFAPEVAAWAACVDGCWATEAATGHVLVRAPLAAEGFTVTLTP